MAREDVPAAQPAPGGGGGVWKVAVLVGVAVAEVLGVVSRHWWSELFGSTTYLNQLAATFAVCLAVFSGRRILEEVSAAGGRGRFPWVTLAAQAGVYALFVWLTIGLVNGGRAGPEAGWWFVAWGVVGAAAVGLWMAAVLPLSGWLRLMTRLRWELGLAGVLAVGVWAAGLAARSLWEPLADVTLRAVEACLAVVFEDVIVDPARRVIGTERFRVQVADACSGYEGFGLVATVVLSYLALCRRQLRFPAALALLPLGIAASWAANVVRIAALIAVGVWTRPEVAVTGFHTQAGWLGFCVVALGVVAVGRLVPAFRRSEQVPTKERVPGLRAAPLIVPLMAVVGTGMLTGAFSDGGPDRLYGVRVLAGGLALWAYRREYSGLGWGWSWPAVVVGLGVFVAWAGLARVLVTTEADSPMVTPAGWPVWEQAVWVLSRVVGAVVVIPVVEELAFRGYLFRRLGGLTADGEPARWRWVPALVSALVFGLVHPEHWVAGMVAGLAYAWVAARRGRVADAALAHAVTNLVLLAYVALTSRWADW